MVRAALPTPAPASKPNPLPLLQTCTSLLTSGSVSHRMAVAGARRSSSLMAEEVRPLAADSRYLPAGRKGRQTSTDKWPTRQAAAQARQQQALPSLVAQLKQHGAPRHTKVMSREDVCNKGQVGKRAGGQPC